MYKQTTKIKNITDSVRITSYCGWHTVEAFSYSWGWEPQGEPVRSYSKAFDLALQMV